MESQKFLELIEKIRSDTYVERELDLHVEEYYEEGFVDRLTDEQGLVLAEALNHNTHITRVNLEGNYIGDAVAVALTNVKTIQSLNLADNLIKQEGLMALAKSNLKDLTVRIVLGEDLVGTEEVLRGFIENKNLESLNIPHSYIPTHLVAELINKNTTIKVLNLFCIEDEALKFISNNKTLKALRISETQLTNKGARYLADNTSIEILEIEESHIGDEGAVFLASLSALKKLHIYSSDITAKGAKVFTYSKLKEFEIHGGNRFLSIEDARHINLTFLDTHNENGEVQYTKKAKVDNQDSDTGHYNTEEPLLLGDTGASYE